MPEQLDPLEVMVARVTDLTNEATALRNEVDSRDRRHILIIVIPMVVVTILAVITLVSILQLQTLANRNRDLNKSNQQLVQEVRDCVDTTGKCHQQNQANIDNQVNKVLTELRKQRQNGNSSAG